MAKEKDKPNEKTQRQWSEEEILLGIGKTRFPNAKRLL